MFAGRFTMRQILVSVGPGVRSSVVRRAGRGERRGSVLCPRTAVGGGPLLHRRPEKLPKGGVPSTAARATRRGSSTQKNALYRAIFVTGDYSLTLSKLNSAVKKSHRWASKAEVDGWIASMPLLSKVMDDNVRYYSVLEPVESRLPQSRCDAVATSHTTATGHYQPTTQLLVDYVKAEYTDFILPYDRPLDILADFQLVVKKSIMPKTGTAKIWLPFPINTACQNAIELIALDPAGYLVGPPDVNASLGGIYLEIPVAEVGSAIVVRAAGAIQAVSNSGSSSILRRSGATTRKANSTGSTRKAVRTSSLARR